MGASPPLASYPMARYKQGQEVVLAWPSKNHVAATCTNAFIPDTLLELFIAAEDADGHPDDFVKIPASFSDEPHVNGVMDFKGFQNCPKFCDNMDKALCTGSFFVPSDLPDGVYTFQWKWEFNAGTAPYITCFEAYVGQDVAPVEALTPMPPSPTAEGQVAPSPTQDQQCTVGEWGQCGGPGHEGKCCTGGLPCQRQSQWYSQCRTGCPSGWECENDNSEPVADPVPAPTAEAVPSPTEPVPSPTEPVPSPTDAAPSPVDEEPCSVDVSDCSASSTSVIEAKLVQPSGKSEDEANLESACRCANFCKLFGGGAKYFNYQGSTKKCKCFASASRVKPTHGTQWSGEISD